MFNGYESAKKELTLRTRKADFSNSGMSHFLNGIVMQHLQQTQSLHQGIHQLYSSR